MQSFFCNYVHNQSPMSKTDALIGQHGVKFDNMVSVNSLGTVFYVMKKNLWFINKCWYVRFEHFML